MLEAVPVRRHHPVRHHRPPARRFYGGPVHVPVFYEPQVIKVERSAPALPWRVVEVGSWGAPTKMQSAHMGPALKYFKDYRWHCPTPFNMDLQLQRWADGAWRTVARRNSGEQNCHGRVDPLPAGSQVYLPAQDRWYTVGR